MAYEKLKATEAEKQINYNFAFEPYVCLCQKNTVFDFAHVREECQNKTNLPHSSLKKHLVKVTRAK